MNTRYRYSRSRRRRQRSHWWERQGVKKWLSRSLATSGIALVVTAVSFGIYLLMPEPTDKELINRALEYKQQGDLASAGVELKAVLLREPTNVEARWLLSEIHLLQRNGAASLEQIERAIELGHRGRDSAYRLIRALLMDEQFEKALAHLAFFEASEEDPVLHILRGQARLGLSRAQQAREAFQKALHLSPGHPDALIGKATAAFALEEIETARQLVDLVLVTDPKNHLGWMLRGEIAMGERKGPDAQAAFEKALSFSANDLGARLALVQSLLVQRKFDHANVHLSTLLKKHREHPSLQFLVAQRELTEDSNLESAEAALQLALKESPEDTSSLLLMGWLKWAKGETETAIQHLNAYRLLLPGEPIGSKLLATILLRRGELTRAIEVLQLAENESPEDLEVVAMLGNAYLQSGNHERAKVFFSKAVAAAPDAAPIRTQLALSLLASGDMERGVGELEWAVGADPEYLRAEFLLALLHYQTGDNEKTLVLARSMAEKHPHSPLPYILMAAVQEDQGNIEAADQLYTRSLELAPDNVLARYNLARISVASGELETARERFQSVLLLEPDHLPSIIALAQIEIDEGAWEEALSLLELGREKNPGALGLRLELSRMYLRIPRVSDALILAQEATELAPYHSGARLALGRAQLSAGRPEAARETLARVVKQLPGSAIAHFELATAQLRSNDLEAAQMSLNRALTLAPGNVEIRAAKGRLLLLQGEPDKAMTVAEEIQKEHLKSAEGYVLQGDILMLERMPGAALTAYESGVYQSGSRIAVMKLQAAHRIMGDDTRAELVLRHWLSEHPQDMHARVILGTALAEAGELETAAIEFNHALKYQPGNGILHNNLAWIYGQTMDARALDHAKRAHELLPDNPDVLDTYGWLLAQNDDPHQGLSLLENAAAAAPDDPGIRYHLAGAMVLTGQPQRARRELVSILNSPQNEIGRHVLAQGIADLE